MRKITSVVFLAAALALSVGNAAAVPYTFTNIVDSSGGFGSFAGNLVNNSGTVAFVGLLDTLEQGIFTASGGPITTIADTSGPFSDVFGSSLNNSGTMAFLAYLDTGEQGIFTGSGGPTTTIVDTTSGAFDILFAPSLNNRGMVAFSGYRGLGGGIFTGPDLLADEVISIDDTLFGSTVAFLSTGPGSLNGTGQIAFSYLLADGRVGIARADPLVTPAPEPGTLPLLIAGLLGALLWRKGKST